MIISEAFLPGAGGCAVAGILDACRNAGVHVELIPASISREQGLHSPPLRRRGLIKLLGGMGAAWPLSTREQERAMRVLRGS